ncbi:uncharacterized protein LOC129232988 [Uloborus diversus]|uniref:uncharacterized protein LOC129232988 n=1 Tax=Uloborus diversus TaxID=327109 RepID=UPI00240A913B|nr:uncharacterized protein LOC129232988 [Uloborus diversus]
MASASRSNDLDLTGLLLSDLKAEDLDEIRLPSLRTRLKSYVWTDAVAKDVPSPHSPDISLSDIIRMGDCMIIMLARGPTDRLGELVAALALQIRDHKLRRMFPQDQFEARILEGDVIGQTVSVEVLQEIEMFVAEHHKISDIFKKGEEGNRPQFFLDLRCAEDFFLRYPHLNKPDWDDTLRFFSHFESVSDEVKAAFYCFVAAMLVRCCVKSPETVKRNLEKTEESFRFLVSHRIQGLILPTPMTKSLKMLGLYFKPGGKFLRQVLKVFLLHRYYSKTIHPAACEILNFTLLEHCKYNGMQMIALTEMTSDIEGDSLSSFHKYFHNDATNKSWAKICTYFETYLDANNPAYPGYLAPWSRLFHNEFWSNLHIKHHSALGRILLAACECQNPTIWHMKKPQIDPYFKKRARERVEEYRKGKERTK